MTNGKIPCSVLILTRLSAGTLDRCLRHLDAFGEILVHDANSTDNSVDIAKRFGARVLKQVENDEANIKIQNFTAMRLKQRDDAAYDWVLYLDSDEELSDEVIVEIREILKTAHPKTIIRIPRLPIIDGKPRSYGFLASEIVPRLHHRKSGATLKGNKGVHEKYVYDSSFKEIRTKHPLYNTMPPLEELRSKDGRYITLEVTRIQKNGYAWSKYIRWILFREPVIILYLACRVLLNIPRYWKKDAVPLRHDWRFVTYHARLFRAITGAMLAHPFTSGRVPGADGSSSVIPL